MSVRFWQTNINKNEYYTQIYYGSEASLSFICILFLNVYICVSSIHDFVFISFVCTCISYHIIFKCTYNMCISDLYIIHDLFYSFHLYVYNFILLNVYIIMII